MSDKQTNSNIVDARDIKPKFDELKSTWHKMLSKYFDKDQNILPQYQSTVDCDFCHKHDYVEQFTLNGFVHNKCNNCGTLFVSPRLSDEVLSELYSDSYYSEVYGKSMLLAFDARKEKIGKSKAAQILKHLNQNIAKGKYLDIGAGIGEVPDVLRDMGWETEVTEMNTVAIDWLRTRNHKTVFHGTFDDFKTDHKYNVITAWGVIEHVVDADTFLKKAFGLLESGGLFVSEVPHADCLLVNYSRNTGIDPERILMGEQHIVLYSKKAYEELHRRNGFELVHIQTNGLDFSTIVNLEKLNVPNEIILNIQKSIDDNYNGDLLRGFWRKVK